ncbi:MAG: basic amino acid ABC transporter substrate-binding protein [Candidatus Fimadaptatus sp.]
MKKLVSVILAAALLIMCSVCFAEGETVLRAGTNPEFAPFEYVGDSGEIEGIDIDIINEIAKDLGATITMEAMDFDALVPSLVSGKLDIAIAGMTITDERKQSVLFSDPYFNATQVVILPENSEIATQDDLKGKRIGVQMGTTGDLMVSEESFGAGEISRYNKGMDAALDLVNGRLDAVVIDTLPAKQFVASLTGLVVREDILVDVEVEAYGIAVQLGQEELIEKINASLARMMEDGTYDAILVKYVEAEDEAAEGETAEGETVEAGVAEVATAEN